MPLGTSLGTGSLGGSFAPRRATPAPTPPSTPPPGSHVNSQGQWWNETSQTWVTPSTSAPTYPGQIPFTGTAARQPAASPVNVGAPSYATPAYTPSKYNNAAGHGANIPSSYLQPAVTGPSAQMQWLNSQLQLLAAQAGASNADLAALANAQAAAARAGSGSGPPPDWQLMKDRLVAALGNSKRDYGNMTAANAAAVQGIGGQYTNAFNNLTSDATARGAVISRGYGLGLNNAASVRDADLARQTKYMADADLSLQAANQAYGFGLRDIADQQKQWNASKGAASAAANAQAAAIMAQLHMQQNANTAAATQAQLALVGPLISQGGVNQQLGLNALLGPNFSMGKPKPKPKPKPVSRPVGYQRV